MKSCLLLASLSGAALLAGCTYGIVPDAGGQNVRTAWNGGMSGCRDVGKVTVSVLSRIGPVDRNDIKVRDELEVMARNQAAQMHADTIVPLGEPKDGEQSWEGYACGNVVPAAAPPPSSGAPVRETSPIDDAPIDNAPVDNNAQPAPFSEPAPASIGGAQTFPASNGSDG
ncbi:MAG: DUF4156 domain-containing protein [Rhodanobacteraceae bacterium]|nr:DUF4156 domain-containing protein [Pseudomonadota bacterium]